MSGAGSTIGSVQRSVVITAIASIALATVLTGCGGGRIGDIASERAATAAIPNTSGSTVAVTTISTTGATTPATGAPDGTSTDPADAASRLGNDIRDIVASVAAMQVALTGAIDPVTSGPIVDQVTQQLQVFDRSAASIGAYRVEQDDVEALRGRIEAAAPAASDAVRAFIDSARQAADTNDASALAAARDRVNAAFSAFLAVVTPTS